MYTRRIISIKITKCMLILNNDIAKLYEKKVLFIVNKYSNNYNREDLYQAGMMGLIKASKNYDEEVGVKFSTFCEKYILGEILEYIRKDKNIKLSRDFIRLKKKIDIAKSHIIESTGIEPTVEQLSLILNESKDKIILVLNTNQNVRSIDEKLSCDNDDILLKDTISEEEKIDRIDLISLNDALNELDESDRNLIYERYYNGKTQTEVANEMNISQVKAYRMERKILDELEYKLAS